MTELSTRRTSGPAAAPGSQLQDTLSGSSLDPAQPLIWRRSVPLAPDFELRQGGAVFGEMEPANRAEADATGECLGRSLEFRLDVKFTGSLRVESRAFPGDLAGPTYRGLFYGWGRITTADGEPLRWRHALSRLYDHVLKDGTGVELLRLRPTFLRFGRTETKVILSSRGWAREDLAELLLLTWFLRAHVEARGRRVFKRSRRLFSRS